MKDLVEEFIGCIIPACIILIIGFLIGASVMDKHYKAKLQNIIEKMPYAKD